MNILFRNCAIIFLFFFSIVQCSSKEQHDQSKSVEELPVIEYESRQLIAEDEDYIPGMLDRVFQLADSSWVVSDFGSTTIEHFSADGEHVSTVAEEGEGPGEVRPYFFFHKFSDSLVVARQQMSNRLDYYNLNRQGSLRHLRTKSVEQGAFIWSDLLPKSPGALIAIEQKNWLADNLNYNEDAEYYRARVMTLDFDLNIIQDSLITLSLPNPRIFRSSQGGVSVFSVPFRSQSRILPLGNGFYWVARGLQKEFELYDQDNQLVRSFKLPVEPGEVQNQDIEYQLGRIKGERRSDLESRMPSTKPLFFDAWADVGHILLQTDESKEGKEYVLITNTGKLVGRFILPNSMRVQQIYSGNLVVINSDPEKGQKVDLVKLKI